MAYDAITQRLISLKKLAGKAQTSNDKDLANEGLPSGLTLSSNTVFGDKIPTTPSPASLYTMTGPSEYVRFTATFIAGSDTSDGRHGFELALPSDYEANSSNSKKGTYPYINNQKIYITSGSLQLVPPAFSTSYEAKPFYGGTSSKNSGTQIPILDARDWYLDYFNGIMFQQDPPGTGDHSNNPDFVEAYLYVGDMLSTVVSASAGSTGGGDPNAQYLVLSATGSLTAERVLTIGTGLSSSDGGSGGNYTLNVDNSIVATLTGSQFSGNVGITGSCGATLGMSGSLTRLTDGSSYLIAGSNITIASSSNGAVTITSTAAGSGTSDRNAQYLVLSLTGSLTNERLFATGSGITGSDGGAGGIYTIDTDPKMSIYSVTSSHAQSAPLVLPSVDFSYNSKSFHKNLIFLNGVLLASGSSLDYTLSSLSTGSVVFNMQLKNDDVIIVHQS